MPGQVGLVAELKFSSTFPSLTYPLSFDFRIRLSTELNWKKSARMRLCMRTLLQCVHILVLAVLHMYMFYSLNEVGPTTYELRMYVWCTTEET